MLSYRLVSLLIGRPLLSGPYDLDKYQIMGCVKFESPLQRFRLLSCNLPAHRMPSMLAANRICMLQIVK